MGSKSRPMLDFQFHHFLACVISLTLSFLIYKIILVQFSCSVVSDSLRPHGLQHARPPCQ